MMTTVSVIMLSFLISAAISAPLKGKEESKTLLHGEDFSIPLPQHAVEVTFRNRSDPRKTSVVMRGNRVISDRAKPTLHLNHLIIEAVGEGDEGLYTLKNLKDPSDVKQISLIVRDCTLEKIVRYGGNFYIQMKGVNPPITLEYKPSAVEANQTSRPASVVLTATGTPTGTYRGRISVSEESITISAVTGADEGSYTVTDSKGAIQNRVCLNVKEHKNFATLSQGETLKISLILNSSLVQLYYTPESDPSPILLMDKGEFTSAQADLGFEDRLSLDGSVVYLEQFKASDVGLFKITDLRGFTVSTVQLGLKPYKMESLYVAIIALLGLLAFLLLVCLLSCLIKVKKRAKRAAALEKLAENAGKEDEGDAFRQVVKNITKLSEESKHSQADNTEKSQSTEVDIKGLEVSSKEVGVGNLETSDSGVGFNTALPLDTDTDVPDQIPDSEAEGPPFAAESKPAATPVPETKASPVPETKKAPDQPLEAKLDTPKPVDTKLSPTPSPKSGLSPAEKMPAPSPSPEPKTGLSPADPKPAPSPSPEPKTGLSPADPKPAPSPSPEPKIAAPTATSLTPEIKSAAAAAPEPHKPAPAEPITNGTPEPGPDSKASPDHAEVIKDPTPKEVSVKSHEVELKSSSVVPEGSKDGAGAEDTTTT